MRENKRVREKVECLWSMMTGIVRIYDAKIYNISERVQPFKYGSSLLYKGKCLCRDYI